MTTHLHIPLVILTLCILWKGSPNLGLKDMSTPDLMAAVFGTGECYPCSSHTPHLLCFSFPSPTPRLERIAYSPSSHRRLRPRLHLLAALRLLQGRARGLHRALVSLLRGPCALVARAARGRGLVHGARSGAGLLLVSRRAYRVIWGESCGMVVADAGAQSQGPPHRVEPCSRWDGGCGECACGNKRGKRARAAGFEEGGHGVERGWEGGEGDHGGERAGAASRRAPERCGVAED